MRIESCEPLHKRIREYGDEAYATDTQGKFGLVDAVAYLPKIIRELGKGEMVDVYVGEFRIIRYRLHWMQFG